MKDVQLVTPRRHVGNDDFSMRIRDAIVRRVHSDHDRAHLSVNITENKRNSGLVELNEACRSALVQSKIEALSVEQRKYIVKKRIAIRKLNLAARRDHNQRRLEALIFLHK